MLFKKNKNNLCLLGLDLTTSTIKILELSKRKQNYQVENYAIAHLNKNTTSIENLIQHNASSLTETLSEQLTLSRFKTKNVAIAIADNNIISKIVRFDKSCTLAEIEQQIALDYMKYFSPISETINYDFYHLGNSHQYPDCVDVWVIGVKQALVNNCINALSETRLQLEAFDLASLAIARACQLIPSIVTHIENKHLFAVLNINLTQAALTIYHHYVPLLTRSLLLNLAEPQDNLDINKRPSTSPTNIQSALTQQLHQILDSFHASYDTNTVKHLLICGDISNIVALSEHLNAEFNISCSVANPFCNLSFADHCDVQLLIQQAHQWMICCGLAMRMRD